MAIRWKLILDVLFVLLVTGAVGLTIFVQQKAVFTYINMGLVSALCILYSLYFNSVRKMDLINLLEENRFTGRSWVRRIRGSLRIFILSGLPYWEWRKLYIVITILYLPFTALMLVTATTSESIVMNASSTVLAILSISYVGTVVRFTQNLKMRFKVKLHGGSLTIFSGIFLICNYGILIKFVGGALIIGGICFIYDMWKQYSMGVKLCFDRNPVPVSNENAAGKSAGTSDDGTSAGTSDDGTLAGTSYDGTLAGTSAVDNDEETVSTSLHKNVHSSE